MVTRVEFDLPDTQPPVRQAIPVRVAFAGAQQVIARAAQLARSGAAPDTAMPRWYVLSLQAQALRTPPSFDTLLAPRVLYERVRPLPYQLHVVEQVLREKAPAAILADEVGLGKTIEAGLIYKELALRGVVRSALVLAPKSLLSQWQEELREHFDEDFVLTDEKRFAGFDQESRVICSLPQFVRAFDRVAARPWDLLIVDEAHLLANPDSKRRRCAAQVRARWRLLLTATPVANKLTDLYSLVDLVRPGRLGTLREFTDEYVADPGTFRVIRPARVAQLRATVREVMCRTRRAETDIAFTRRSVRTLSIAPSPEEDAFISDVTDYLRALYRRLPLPAARGTERRGASGGADAPVRPRVNRGAVIREIMALQQSLSSSPRAIEQALRRRAEREPQEQAMLMALADRGQSITSAKERVLLETLAELGSEPALIFTLRLETAARLREVITAAGRSAECYVGALTRAERESLVERFTSGAVDTLIATDAGAEGLNLQQRCHTVFNYDLHWNPMRIEQRIGRVHRLGQTQDVAVYNFVLRDSIDDYVVRLLYQKIDLFTMTIGGLEAVLAELQDGEVDLEERILEALLQSRDRDELSREVEALGRELAGARDLQHEAESLTAGVLG
jgi:SNF2 family DNA or RNA helicase